MKDIAVDAGIEKQLTLSNGIDIMEGVSITNKIKRFHRELTRRERVHGKNWFKAALEFNKGYEEITDKRRDIKDKVVSRIVSTASIIHIQNDNVVARQRMWSRRVQASAIGGVMNALKRVHAPIVVGRFVPTTKTCHECGNVQDVGLEERIFVCQRCSLRIGRNLNPIFCINQAIKGKGKGKEGRWRIVPMVRRELTPVDIKASIYRDVGILQIYIRRFGESCGRNRKPPDIQSVVARFIIIRAI